MHPSSKYSAQTPSSPTPTTPTHPTTTYEIIGAYLNQISPLPRPPPPGSQVKKQKTHVS